MWGCCGLNTHRELEWQSKLSEEVLVKQGSFVMTRHADFNHTILVLTSVIEALYHLK